MQRIDRILIVVIGLVKHMRKKIKMMKLNEIFEINVVYLKTRVYLNKMVTVLFKFR